MARYVDAIDLPVPIEEAFDYLADFRITEFERPVRLVLSGGDSSIQSIDEITFVSTPAGTRVSYEARLDLAGIRRIADPFLDLLLQRIGRLAVRGLRERLAEITQGTSRDEGANSAPKPDRRHQKRTMAVRTGRGDPHKGAIG